MTGENTKKIIPEPEKKPSVKKNNADKPGKKILNNVSGKLKRYFSHRSVGVDVSDYSIEIVEVKKNANKSEVNYGRVLLEPGMVSNGDIIDAEKLRLRLLAVLRGATPQGVGSDNVVFALPESRVFSHVFSTTFSDQSDLKKKVAKEVESSIPLPFDDVLFSYKVIIDRSKDKTNVKESEIIIAAASKSLINQWHDLFSSLKMDASFFEIEPCAYCTGLIIENPAEPVCVVDIGAKITNISILSADGLFYSQSVLTGGDVLTQKIVDESTQLGKPISHEQVEEAKKMHGFEAENKFTNIFKSVMNPIIEEVVSALIMGEMRAEKKINDCILIGGTSLTKGLLTYFSEQVNKSVPINVKLGRIKNVSGVELPLEYVEAMGLALIGVEKDSSAKMAISIEDSAAPSLKNSEKTSPTDNGQTKNSIIKTTNSNRKKEEEEDPGLKAKKQMKLLLILVIAGAILVGGSFWMKAQRQKANDKKAVIPAQISFSYQRDIEVEVDISLNSTSTPAGSLKGLLSTDVETQSMSYNDTLKKSLAKMNEKVSVGYLLWPEPIKIYSPKDKLIFPLRIDWFQYPEKQTGARAIEEVNTKMANKKYLFNSSTIKSAKFDEINNKVVLKINVSIMADNPN